MFAYITVQAWAQVSFIQLALILPSVPQSHSLCLYSSYEPQKQRMPGEYAHPCKHTHTNISFHIKQIIWVPVPSRVVTSAPCVIISLRHSLYPLEAARWKLKERIIMSLASSIISDKKMFLVDHINLCLWMTLLE